MLQNQGINVTDATFLKLKEGEDTEAVDAILKKLGAEQINLKDLEPTQDTQSQVSDEPCFCPACFNFETFEQVLGETGEYDYKTIQLGKKQFQIKYYIGKYGERIMIQEAVWEIPKYWDESRIQAELSVAVQAKDFKRAQKLLEALQNLKK